MVVERKITKKYYFMTFVFTTFVFIIAFLMGWYVNSINFIQSTEQLSELKTNLLRYDLQHRLFGYYPCEYIDGASPVFDEFVEIGQRIARLEIDLGKHNSKVISLKTYYSLLEISDWMHYNDLNEKCGADHDLILFFYSNNEDACPSCDRQGFILDHVYANHPSVRTYSFDVDLGMVEIEMLEDRFGVDRVPSVVVNGYLLSGFSELEDIEALL